MNTLQSLIVFTVGFLFTCSGCSVVTSNLQLKEEQLYDDGHYEETIKYLERNDGYFKNPKERLRILNENLNLARQGKSYTFEFIHYAYDLRWYISSLIETGRFEKALFLCDQGLHDLNNLLQEMIRMNRSYKVAVLANLAHYSVMKGYIVWFTSANEQKTEEYFKEAIEYSSQLIKDRNQRQEEQSVVRTLFAPFQWLGANLESKISANLHLNIGSFEYKVKGDYSKANQHFQELLRIAESLEIIDSDAKYGFSLTAFRMIASLNMRYGYLQEAKDILDRYEIYTKKSLYKFGRTFLGDTDVFRGLLVCLDSTAGAVYAMSRDFARANGFFSRAFETMSKIPVDAKRSWDQNAIATYYTYYGAYFQGLQGNYSEGLRSIEKGISHLKPYYTEAVFTDLDVESAYLHAAEMHYLVRDYAQSLKMAERALEYSIKYQNVQGKIHAQTLMGEIYLKTGRINEAKLTFEKAIALLKNSEDTEKWRLFLGIGNTYELLGNQTQALPFYSRAIENVERLWQGRFKDVRRQVSFIDQRLIAFEPMIRVLTDQKNSEEALNYIERSKARTFFDNNIFGSRNEPDGKVSPIDAKQIREIIPVKSAILEYYIGQEIVVGSIITNKRAITQRLPTSPGELRQNVSEFTDAMKKPSLDLQRSGRTLYDSLIKPFERNLAGCESIIIIPHGLLHYVPFHALVTGPRPEGSESLYLINRFRISYAPSATVLAKVRERTAPKGERLLAVASPPTQSDLPRLEKLTYAKEEAEEVCKLFAETLLLTDTKATKSAVIELSPKYNLILFSTHAALTPEDPLKSFVLFDKGNLNDGRLTVSEIENLNLNASLVALSACNTGFVSGYEGKAKQDVTDASLPIGDDLVSLQRAFLKSGASSVISTLWSVDDESTKELIVDFFRKSKNVAKLDALRSAQLMLLSTKNYRHPYHWAPFLLSGNWE